MQGLWAAFPDLDFTLGTLDRVDHARVHGAWRMHGHNHGSFHGLPPSGRPIDVAGLDVIEVGPDGVRSVTGYFDSAGVPRQLGLDVIVQPREIGPFTFGTSSVVRRPRPAIPGALAFTELTAAGDAQLQPIRDLSRQTVMEHLGNEAFLGFTGAVTGRRMTTVSAWTSHEAMSAAMRGGTHAQAMQRFFRDGIAEAGHTAVYTPVRFGPFWRLCGGCGAMSKVDGLEGACTRCGGPIRALA